MTPADLIAAAFVLTIWTWAAVAFVREWAAERRHKARVREIAADTCARHQRQEAADDFTRHVTSAFNAARDPWHTTRAEIAALETTEDR